MFNYFLQGMWWFLDNLFIGQESVKFLLQLMGGITAFLILFALLWILFTGIDYLLFEIIPSWFKKKEEVNNEE